LSKAAETYLDGEASLRSRQYDKLPSLATAMA